MKEDVKLVLQKKADAIMKGTDLLLEKTRDWQTIKAFLSNRLGELELTEMQAAKLKRYQFIYDQLSGGKYTTQEIVSQLTNKSHFGISISQAYEDISCTQEIWNSLLNINKRFEIKLELEINRRLMRKAEELGDLKAVAAFQKNRAALYKLLPDEDDTPADAFEGHVFEAVFDPRLLGAPDVDMKEVLRIINEKRDKKINVDLFDDIPFEEQSNDTDPNSLQQAAAPE